MDLQAFSQRPVVINSAEIEQKLQKLNVLGNVLYVAAHPDDENTRLIAYLANEKKVNAAYFACTRGDGGQNLIGPEIREKLGVIRTQELLQARRIDHGIQFFSRAVDFGYSKNPDETFNIWDKEQVLSDLVWVIRKFKPDIIITRFNTVPGTTHGHHTASAILAAEAFDLAGNASSFPEQLQSVDVWQPKTLYWNAYWWRKSDYQKDTSELIKIDVGKYNALLGTSYTEIAARSRSSHKSQGFGVSGSRGEQLDYLQYEKGVKARDDAFDVVDISWNRVAGGKAISMEIEDILSHFVPNRPYEILPRLIDLKEKVAEVADAFWRSKKIQEIDDIIYDITGLYLEAKGDDFTVSQGQTLNVNIEAINRSPVQIELKQVIFNTGTVKNYNLQLDNNEDHVQKVQISVPQSIPYSQPYWLANKHGIGMFEVDDQQLIGKPENDPSLTATFVIEVNGQTINYKKPLVYKKTDPVRGELYRSLFVTPPVFANLKDDILIFADGNARKVTVEVMAGKDDVQGKVKLQLPDNWQVQPADYQVSLGQKGERKLFEFTVIPPVGQETVVARAIVELGDKSYSYSYQDIDYQHIPFQLIMDPAEAKFVRLNLKRGNEKIGYLMGAGDNIPENLRQIGYRVDLINDLDFNQTELSKYDVIILGVRALNTLPRLKFDMPSLFDYTKNGGTLIVQYNTSYKLVTDQIAPYPLRLSHDRITVEDTKVTVLAPANPVLNYPNKINEQDFEHWVQERGLYFPDQWSKEFTSILSAHDPGEKPLKGGLLVADYGKGHFIYTGYSWFRELPAGVPGAYRIFVNMISIGEATNQ